MSVDLLNGLVSYFKLDGNSVSSVGSFTGTDTTISYANSTGKINQGASFGGASKIDLPNGSMTTGSGARSMSIWIYPTTDDFDTIFGHGNTGSYNHFLVHTNLPGTGQIYVDVGATAMSTTASCITKNAWNHIVITFAGGNFVAANLGIYVNGVKYSTDAGTAIGFTSTDTNMSLGWDRAYATRYFTGYIDEFAAWSRQLSEEEVTTLYRGGIGNTYPFLPTNIKSRPGSLGQLL